MVTSTATDVPSGIEGVTSEWLTSALATPVTDVRAEQIAMDTKTNVGSMEIFRVVDGRIVEVWNCGYKQGVWQ